jgi:hypothetical protein
MWNREERPGQYASSRHFCRGFPAHPDDDARPLTGNAGNLGDGRGRRTRYPIGGMALIWLCLLLYLQTQAPGISACSTGCGSRRVVNDPASQGPIA